MFENKNALRIISLVAAVLLWFYVMGEVDPDKKAKISNIPVYFTNTDELADEGLAVVQDEQITINASVKGARSDVNDIKKSGLTAYIDVSDADKGKNEAKISINMPSGVSLESISDETAEFVVEELASEAKPVVIEFDVEKLEVEGQIKVPFVTESGADEVMVYGAQSSVSKVTAVKGTVVTQEAREDEARTIEVSMQAVDGKGNPVNGIELENRQVSAEIRLMTVRNVEVGITPINVKYGKEIAEMQAAEKLTVAGPADEIAHLKQLTASVDLSGIKDTGKAEMVLDLPENIYFYDDKEKLTVAVTLKTEE